MKKRLFSTVLGAVMSAALCVPAMAAELPMLIMAPPKNESAVIFYTNDIHTYIDNTEEAADGAEIAGLRYSTLAALKDSVENSLLVDAGDHVQGTAYGSVDKGESIVKLMNAAGYDIATLGNHEFDYGMEGLEKIIEQAEYDYISCNFYREGSGENVLEPYKVVELAGMKIAFIGITTPETFNTSTPAYFQNEKGEYIYGIRGRESGQALYDAVQAAIDAASAEADIIIALGHLGVDEYSDPWNSGDVIANTTGLDAFIDGHSHTAMEGMAVADKSGKNVWLTQTGEYLNAVGKMTIASDGTITTQLLDTEDLAGLTPNARVRELEEAWIGAVSEKLGEKIGSIEDTLDNYDAEGSRLARIQETNTGDFAADALYYLFDNMGLEVDVAVMNGGGIRNRAITGDITYLTCKAIHTFGNVACLQTITGQQLLDALEWGAQYVGICENGGFLHVSGLKYTVDPFIPSTVQKNADDAWAGGPTGEYRVKDVQILNRETGAYEPLDLKAEYNLAGYNYTLRDLGDGFAMFDGAVNVLDYVMEDYMVLANYVQSFENGKVTGYAQPQGRITILTAPAETPAEPEVPAVPAVPPAAFAETYTVSAGDTLWGIAAKTLGSGAKWNAVYEANRASVADPNLIYAGQMLVIPAA